MTHPEDLLAGYVDGALSSRERASVDAHLASCERCTHEVALASATRTALASLPELPAPSGLAEAALREARGDRVTAAARRRSAAPRWYRFAGVAAAAAAALVVLAIALPHVGGGSAGNDGSTERAAANGAAGSALQTNAATATTIEVQSTDYDAASLSTLAASFGSAAPGNAAQASPAAAPKLGTSGQTASALRCIQRSAPKEAGQLTKLILARFKGVRAYLAVFLEGPGANQPPDSVTVWVFATDGCRILSSSIARL